MSPALAAAVSLDCVYTRTNQQAERKYKQRWPASNAQGTFRSSNPPRRREPRSPRSTRADVALLSLADADRSARPLVNRPAERTLKRADSANRPVSRTLLPARDTSRPVSRRGAAEARPADRAGPGRPPATARTSTASSEDPARRRRGLDASRDDGEAPGRQIGDSAGGGDDSGGKLAPAPVTSAISNARPEDGWPADMVPSSRAWRRTSSPSARFQDPVVSLLVEGRENVLG